MKQKLLSSFRLRVVMLVAILCSAFTGAVWGDTYTKVTTAPSDWSGTYVIIADASNVIFTGQSGTNNYGGYATVNISNNSVTGNFANYEVEVVKSGDYYTIKHVSSSKYLGWTSGNYLYFDTTTPEANTYKWSLTTSSILNANDNSRKLQYNSGSPRFACYTSSQKVAYLYKKETSSSTSTCATPTFSPAAGTYTSARNVTISTATEGATIYYTTDGSDPTTNSTVYVSAINVSSTTTIKAMAAANGYDNSSVASAIYTIVNLVHAGTQTDPYTVVDARKAIDANVGMENVYATGVVSEIVTAYDTSHSNITFDIKDENGTETLRAYRCGGTDAANVMVGDEVVVSGSLTKYGDIYEFGSGCQLVSLTHPVVPTIIASPSSLSEFTYVRGQGPSTTKTISVSGLNLSADISISLNNNSDFEMSLTENGTYTNSLVLTPSNGEVAESTVYVRLKSDLSENSYSGTISLSSFDASNVAISLSGSVTAPEAANVAWNLSADETATATITEMTWTSSYATMAVAKGSATTNTNNYYPGTNNYSSTRFYKNSVLTITPASGYTILSVVFTATSESYANALVNSTWNNATATANGTTVTVTPTNGASALSATIGGTCGFTLVKVYYEVDTTPIIESANKSITYGVTSGSIDYTITNEGNGSLTASVPSGSWLTIETITSSEVQFSCAANVGAERSTTVTLTYTYDTNKTVTKDVIVTQAGKPYSVSWTAGENTELFIFAGDESEAINNGGGVVVGTTVMVSFDVTSGYTGTLTVKDANNDDVSLTEITEGSYYSFVMPASNVTITSSATQNSVTPTPGAGDKCILVDLADLTENDIFVITGSNSAGTYAMSNSNGTSSAPTAVEVAVTDNKISNITENLQWSVSGNAEDGYIFYPNGDSEKWLYATNTNNGVRVGTNGDNKTFSVDEGYLKNNATSRYIGIYNSQDWRCYTSINDNIKGQSFAFYKKVESVKLNDSYGYATFASTSPLNFSDYETAGYSAWAVKSISGTTITFEQIKGIVPAGTGVLLRGGTGVTVNIPVANKVGSAITNLLEGITTATDVTAEQYYGLSGNQFVKVNAGTVPAGKALLPASIVENASGNARLSFFFEGEDTTTGISTMHNSEFIMHNEVYNLNGQRVNDMKKGGLYIMNGKKVIVK